MNARSIKPLETARDFKCNEMFFSTTDEKGVILTGNDVFVRVSGFTREELYGRPHNVIRHPEMPRAVFSLLWENLKAKRPFAGYVNNMAKDGGFYWVFVVVVPASGDRYLSVRFKPTSPMLAKVQALYKQMLAAENVALANGGKERDAVAAGVQVAVAALRELNFSSYDVFSHVALNLEMNARDAQMQTDGTRLFMTGLNDTKTGRSLSAIYAFGIQTYAKISGLFRQLDSFVQFNNGLQERAAAVLATSEDFRLHALNVDITSQRHGTAGIGVSVVADFLSTYAGQLSKSTIELSTHTAEIAHATESINACVATARLQMEMLLFFLSESATQETAVDIRQIKTLEECFVASTEQVLESLTLLRKNLPLLLESHKMLLRCTISIEVAQVSGRTETARIADADTLINMFSEFRAKIKTTRTHLDDLCTVIDQIVNITNNTPGQIAEINSSTQRMQADIAAFTLA